MDVKTESSMRGVGMETSGRRTRNLMETNSRIRTGCHMKLSCKEEWLVQARRKGIQWGTAF